MELTAQQQLAIDHCLDLNKRVVAVTGAAGTGKTTIIKQVYERLSSQGPNGMKETANIQVMATHVGATTSTHARRPALCAPTGKAARRISESTGIPAVTCHKLLGYGRPEVNKETGEPMAETYAKYHKDNPLPYTDVIVDEYAMVNEELHRSLIDALPSGGRILVFGDVNQLPPIEPHELSEPYSPFQRLLQLPNSVTLTQVFRQEAESGILSNARRTLSGLSVNRLADFRLEISSSPIAVLRSHLASSGIDYMATANQIITPNRRGQVGSTALNPVVQSFYDNRLSGEGLFLTRHKWEEDHPCMVYVGDKVIVNENTYDLRDFFSRFQSLDKDGNPDWRTFVPPNEDQQILNGEIGTVSEIDLVGEFFTIKFPDRYVNVPFEYREWNPKAGVVYVLDPRKRIDLGYVVTTHKMQGSECDNVCFITHQIGQRAVNRNNIYTAITRAKKSVMYIADVSTWRNGPRLTAQAKELVLRENDRKRKKKTI